MLWRTSVIRLYCRRLYDTTASDFPGAVNKGLVSRGLVPAQCCACPENTRTEPDATTASDAHARTHAAAGDAMDRRQGKDLTP